MVDNFVKRRTLDPVGKVHLFGPLLLNKDIRVFVVGGAKVHITVNVLLPSNHFVMEFLVDKFRVEVDSDHAPIFCECPEHVVGGVARMVVERTAGGMGKNHRLCAYLDRSVEGFIRNVREIDHHPDAVHFPNYLLAEFVQSVPTRLIGGGIRPVIGVRMRESQIADTQALEHPQRCETILDAVPALHAHQGGDLALLFQTNDVRCINSDPNLVRIGFHGAVHSIDHFKTAANRSVRGIRRVRPDGKEYANATFPEARNIHGAVGKTL